MTKFSDLPDTVGVGELGRALGVSRAAISDVLKRREFPTVKQSGKHPYIVKADLISLGHLLPEIYQLKIALMRIMDCTRASDAHELAKEAMGTNEPTSTHK